MVTTKSLKFLFGIIIIILLSLSYFTYKSLMGLIENARWMNKTIVILGELETIMSVVKDGETGHRGYQLTNDSIYLEPYFNSKWVALSKIDLIDSLIDTNELQEARMDSLRLLVQNQYDIIEQIIRRGVTHDFDAYGDSLLYAGNENMRALRILIDKLKNEKWENVRLRGDANNDKLTPILIFLSFVFAIGVVVYLFSQIYKNLKTKISAEKALEYNLMQLSREANEKLRARESLQRVLDSSPNAIIFMEAIREGMIINDFQLVLYNRSFELYFGVNQNKVPGQTLLQLIPQVKDTGVFDLLVDTTESGKVSGKEFRYKSGDRESWFQITAVKLEDGCVITFTDTTAQKNSAKLIEESRQKFQAIFNKTFQFIGLIDVKGRILDANQTVLEFANVAKDQVVGEYLWFMNWWSPEIDTRKHLKMAVQKAATGEFIRYEVEVRGYNNEKLPLDFSLKPIKNKSGEIQFIILEGRDLTEIKKAEAERYFISGLNLMIANSNSFEEAVQKVIEKISERFGLDYCEVWVPEDNELVLSDTYYSREKEMAVLHKQPGVIKLKRGEGLPGRVMETFEIQYIEDIDSVLEEKFIKLDQALDFGLTTVFGIPIIFNNELILVSTFFSKRQIEEVEEIISAIEQISSALGALLVKKRTQDEIERNNIVLASAESITKIGSWEWNMTNNKMKWSKGMFELFQKSSEKFTPTYEVFLEYIHPDDRHIFQDYINHALEFNTSFKMEFRVMLESGEIKYLAAIATPKSTKEGVLENVFGTVQDVTQQKIYEQDLLIKNEELKKSNENLEQFAYVASHDLQEPLRKIRAFGDRIQSQDETDENCEADVKRKDYISRMQNAAERMSSLIEDLLKYSRVARTSQPFSRVDLNEIINGVLTDLEMAVKERNAEVTVDKLPVIEGDASQLRQLFQNLISNSIKFTPPEREPKLRIIGNRVRGSVLKSQFSGINSLQKYFAEIKVCDNGIGFNDKYAERIFNIFERLHGRSEFKGTGIGLAISKKVVQNHNGFIKAESRLGEGASFTIILPINFNNYG